VQSKRPVIVGVVGLGGWFGGRGGLGGGPKTQKGVSFVERASSKRKKKKGGWGAREETKGRLRWGRGRDSPQGEENHLR